MKLQCHTLSSECFVVFKVIDLFESTLSKIFKSSCIHLNQYLLKIVTKLPTFRIIWIIYPKVLLLSLLPVKITWPTAIRVVSSWPIVISIASPLPLWDSVFSELHFCQKSATVCRCFFLNGTSCLRMKVKGNIFQLFLFFVNKSWHSCTLERKIEI